MTVKCVRKFLLSWMNCASSLLCFDFAHNVRWWDCFGMEKESRYSIRQVGLISLHRERVRVNRCKVASSSFQTFSHNTPTSSFSAPGKSSLVIPSFQIATRRVLNIFPKRFWLACFAARMWRDMQSMLRATHPEPFCLELVVYCLNVWPYCLCLFCLTFDGAR